MKEEIVSSANKKILFLPHAVTQMSVTFHPLLGLSSQPNRG